MPEQVNINANQAIIEIVAYDAVTIDQMKKSRYEVIQAVTTDSVRYLIHDVRLVTHPPSQESLQSFAIETFKNHLYQKLKIALLTTNKSKIPHSTLTSTARKYGKSVRVFHDKQKAIHWFTDDTGLFIPPP